MASELLNALDLDALDAILGHGLPKNIEYYTRTQIISVKLPKPLIEAFDRAWRQLGFASRSDALRALIVAFVYVVEGVRVEELRRMIVEALTEEGRRRLEARYGAAALALAMVGRLLSQVYARADDEIIESELGGGE